jgi:hypothetical protein
MKRWTMKWLGGSAMVVAVAVMDAGGASARRPEPVAEAELAYCVDSVRLRLAEPTAGRELGENQAYLDGIGHPGLVGAVLEVRSGANGATELVFAFGETPRVGQTGTFGPYAVAVAAVWRQHGVATVKATLAEARAQVAKERAVRLQGEGVGMGEVLAAWNLPAEHAGGMALGRAAMQEAVEAMNAKGGLPWIAWTDREKPQYKRVKVAAVESEEGGWLPVKNPDSALHPLWVAGLDLEKSGVPYLFIAMNDSPVSDKTEVWRAKKGGWEKVGNASGNLVMASREADGKVILRFESYLDASVWVFDPVKRKLSLACHVLDDSVMSGTEVPWANLVLREGPTRLAEKGAVEVPVKSYAEAEAADTTLARGTRVWRLQTFGDQTLVAFVVPGVKSLEPALRKAAGRVLGTGWVPTAETVVP